MGSISVVIRDHDMTGALSLLKVINRAMGAKQVEFILVCDGSNRCCLDVKGKRAKKLLVNPGQLDSGQALNMGAEAANGDVLIFTVGDALPLDDAWLDAADRCCQEPLVAGVCGPILPTGDASMFQRMRGQLQYLGAKLLGRHRIDRLPLPEFSPLNFAIERNLWKTRSFSGAVDAVEAVDEWARWAIGQGMDLVSDWTFAVQCDRALEWPPASVRNADKPQSLGGSSAKRT
jgi:hypothetical protein